MLGADPDVNRAVSPPLCISVLAGVACVVAFKSADIRFLQLGFDVLTLARITCILKFNFLNKR